MRFQAINLTRDFSKGSGIEKQEADILEQIREKFGFQPKENIWRSSYWGKNLGASHWLGNFKKKSAVLKIQGAKPNISEVFMIRKFKEQNKSDLIRPPVVYKTLKWSKELGYEAIIMEYVSGQKVLEDKKLQTSEKIRNFFKYYREYRENCIPKKPWLPRPASEDFILKTDELISTSLKVHPKHPLRQEGDFDLALTSSKLLDIIYEKAKPEFLHGHFSCNDLKYKDKKNKNAVLFSNLFWKWKFPFYDAVFAYHWFMFELSNVEKITPSQVERQRDIWVKELFNLEKVKFSSSNRKLLTAALLERAIAGLVIDGLLMDTKKPISKYLFDSTRNQVKKLVLKLSN